MSLTALLEIILLVNVFVIGLITPTIYRHARAHFSKQDKADEPEETPATLNLPPGVKEHLMHNSEAEFRKVMEHSANSFEHELNSTATQINDLVKRLATEIIGDELERYRTELSQLGQQATSSRTEIKSELDNHRAELEEKLAAEINQAKQQMLQDIVGEKQKLLKQIDTKLGDAVASFLLESLGHNVDLGSQSAYLTSLLEEHKADFAKEVGDESQAT